jgi:hypothetical protein
VQLIAIRDLAFHTREGIKSRCDASPFTPITLAITVSGGSAPHSWSAIAYILVDWTMRKSTR